MTLHEQMAREMSEKKIFDQARDYAYAYASRSSGRNVYPTQEALDNLRVFDESLPSSASDASHVLAMLHQYGSPATVSQIGGRYFGLVNGGVIPAGLAAKWLNDFWDQNTPLYVTSPLVSMLETVVEKWLRQLFGLPDETVAGFVSGTSMAIMCGLAAARFSIYQRLGWDINENGLIGAPRIRIVTGRHAHGTVLKAIALLGLGKSMIEWVDTDDQGSIIPALIPELDSKTIVILQAGNVNSGSFDAFDEICEKANRAGAWVHIDGAFGLWAACSRSLCYLTKGMNLADSWSVDGHKTLNTPYDCGIVLCKDKDALISALQASGWYIVYSDKRDGMLYTPEMSRRARAVELWATLRYLGKDGVDSLVSGLHARAVQFAGEIQAAGFQVMNKVSFNQVLVACSNDEDTAKVMERVQELRECWCGGSVWMGRRVIRISVCSWATTADDITRSVASFVKAAQQLNLKNI